MNIYLALTLFSMTVLVYWIITELFTILFRFMGLPDEKARFQVISLLTGCGFTTHESEMFLSTRNRRRLARVTMLFGYVFNITIVSAFINVFLSLKLSEVVSNMIGFIIPIVVAAVIAVFIRIPKVHSWGERFLEGLAGRIVHRSTENAVLLLDYIGDDVIAQVTLNRVPGEFVNRSLAENGIKPKYNILVMLVDRGKAVAANAHTVFQKGDKLTVFGNYRTICHVFEAEEHFAED